VGAFFITQIERINIMRKVITGAVLVLVFVLSGCTEATPDTLVVGLECNYAPFNWTVQDDSETAVLIDGVNAYCDGYDVMVASHIASELEYELEIRKIEWDGLIPALISNEIDVIIAGMSPTPERAETVLFTDAYYQSEQVFVVRADSTYVRASSLDDFSGASVIAQMGTLQDGLIDQITGVDHMSPLTDYPSLVASVDSGISDALVAERPVAESIVASNDDLVMVILGESGFEVAETDVSVSVALRQSETDLRDAINDILAALDTTTRNEWMSDALTLQP
jgi:ABC-type amino acid transport substrate-binding protein